MPDKFEKDIQNNLHGLRFTPDDSVWTGLEKELDERRHRRGIIWWVLPIGMFSILGILYFGLSTRSGWLNTPSEKEIAGQLSPQNSEKKTAPFSEQENDQEEHTIASERNNLKESKPSSKINQQEVHQDKKNIANHSDINILEQLIRSENNTDDLSQRPGLSSIARSSSIEEITQKVSLIQSINDHSISNTFLVLSEKDPLLNLNPEASEEVSSATISSQSKWKFGLSFSPGISFLSMKNNSVSNTNVLSSPNANNNPVIGDPSANFQPWVSEPKYHSGFSYSLGLSAKRMLGEHWGITSGINFKHITSSHSASAIMRYMSAPSTQRWNDKFNFIEVPVLFSYQSDLGRLKINWEGGITYSRLLSADTWQYDTAVKTFNNQVPLKKNQFGLRGGITLEFLKDKNIGLEVGPYYNYHLSSVGKEGDLKKRHLNSAGIQMRIRFKK